MREIRFDDQVALVTGSGRGLGEAYARLLAERGARVVVHDAGVTLDGTGFDPSIADAVVANITSTGGIAVPCSENIESRALFRAYALPELSGYALGKMAQLGLMNALAAAGAPFDIAVNTICPVAATHMLRWPMAAHEARPEQVAPGVAFLASTQCDCTGTVLFANNGRFSILQWHEGPELDFGVAATTPEVIAEQWPVLRGEA